MGLNLQVPVAELQKKMLFIATPMYGGQCFGSYTKSVLELSRLCAQYGVNAQFSFLFNESLITRARNYMVDEFLRSEATHLMFIDSDIDFNPNDVIALLALDKPIIGGPYPKKCIAWENVYDAARYGLVPPDDRAKLADFAGDFVFNAAPGTTEIKLDAPAQVLEIGTGFMLVERSVFTKFAKTYPQYWYTPDHNRSSSFDGTRKIFQYFQAEIEPERNRYLSEDYWFCQKARQAGMEVWLAPWMQIKHHGTFIYGGSIPAMATVMNERTKRGDAVPKGSLMDGAGATPAQGAKASIVAAPLTIKSFEAYSDEKKNELLAEWSKNLEVPEDLLTKAYDFRAAEWLDTVPDLPVLEKITELATEILKIQEALKTSANEQKATGKKKSIKPIKE